MIRRFQIWLAHRRLQKLVEQRRNSFEVQDYRKRRAAAKLGWQRRAT
jgi:hypothetical protein